MTQPATASVPAKAGAAPAAQRQFVSFTFYRADPAWRRLPRKDRQKGVDELVALVESYHKHFMVHSYSTVGLKADCDFMLWRIGYDLPLLQEMAGRILTTGLGQYLTVPYSYLAMTRRSVYVDKLDPEHQDRRLFVQVLGLKYLFVYPFVKTREWYTLPQEARQGMMDEHITIGNKYPSVRLHTTYSFGLDDQEFVVAFETDKPQDFLDLVMELRGSKASQYTLRDTPIFTCVTRPLREALELVGG